MNEHEKNSDGITNDSAPSDQELINSDEWLRPSAFSEAVERTSGLLPTSAKPGEMPRDSILGTVDAPKRSRRKARIVGAFARRRSSDE